MENIDMHHFSIFKLFVFFKECMLGKNQFVKFFGKYEKRSALNLVSWLYCDFVHPFFRIFQMASHPVSFPCCRKQYARVLTMVKNTHQTDFQVKTSCVQNTALLQATIHFDSPTKCLITNNLSSSVFRCQHMPSICFSHLL